MRSKICKIMKHSWQNMQLSQIILLLWVFLFHYSIFTSLKQTLFFYQLQTQNLFCYGWNHGVSLFQLLSHPVYLCICRLIQWQRFYFENLKHPNVNWAITCFFQCFVFPTKSWDIGVSVFGFFFTKRNLQAEPSKCGTK